MAKKEITTKRKILLIDDEENIRETYKEIFEREGYEICTAEHAGLAAIRAGGYPGPDIIILDWKLSEVPFGKDGPDVLGHLWEDKKYNVPIILHSAYAEEPGFDAAFREIENKFDRRIYKNIPKADLQKLIDTVNDFFVE